MKNKNGFIQVEGCVGFGIPKNLGGGDCDGTNLGLSSLVGGASLGSINQPKVVGSYLTLSPKSINSFL